MCLLAMMTPSPKSEINYSNLYIQELLTEGVLELLN